MQRGELVYRAIPEDFVYQAIPADSVLKAVKNRDVEALQSLRTNHPEVFLHQLTDLVLHGSTESLPWIEANVTKEDRTHYLLKYAVTNDREGLQNEYDRIPVNKRLSAKLVVVEGAVQGGHLDFTEQLIASFPESNELEEEDCEKISVDIARMAEIGGYAQSTRLSLEDRLKKINKKLESLAAKLDRVNDMDANDRQAMMQLAFDLVIKGFYLTKLFEFEENTVMAMASFNFFSLRFNMARAYQQYQASKLKVDDKANLVTKDEIKKIFIKGEQIRGFMLNIKCPFFNHAKSIIEKKPQEIRDAMRLFSYQTNNHDVCGLPEISSNGKYFPDADDELPANRM